MYRDANYIGWVIIPDISRG